MPMTTEAKTFGFRVLISRGILGDFPCLLKRMKAKEYTFDIAEERAGWTSEIASTREPAAIRAGFAMIEDFVVEHVQQDMVVETAMKRVRSCTWFLDAEHGLAWAQGATPAIQLSMAAMLGYGIELSPASIDLQRLRETMTTVSGVELLARKAKQAVRRAKLTGTIEDSDGAQFGGVPVSVSGSVRWPDKTAASLTVNEKGAIRISKSRPVTVGIEELRRLGAILGIDTAQQIIESADSITNSRDEK